MEKQSKHWYQKRWIIEILIGVCIAVVTVLVSQLFYAVNVKTQVRMEYEKETFINQIPIYNRVNSIYKDRGLRVVKVMIVPKRERILQYTVDQFGNQIEVDSILNPTVKWDTLYNVKAPNFIFQDSEYNRLINNLNYIKDHRDGLSPNVYEQFDTLFNFLENHPLPPQDRKIRIGTIYGTWGKEETYTEFYRIISDLHLYIQKNMEKLGTNE